MPDYLLDDENFLPRDQFNPSKGPPDADRLERYFGPNGDYLGHAVLAIPWEAYTQVNPTTPPGGGTAMLIGLMFQLRKWEYNTIQRADEWIEVNPVFAQFYQLTLRQKEELEGKIKQGLASASQAVADLELVKHDQRKYREFLDYFGYEYDDEKRAWKEEKDEKKKKKPDEHALKAMFVDLVDMHTGEGISMRSIVSRWPTLIVDFLKLTDDDTDPDKVREKLDISKAEAVVLVTKNKLYLEWKKLFSPEIKARYERIYELVKSREASVQWYRQWLTPIIARHRLIKEGLQSNTGSMGVGTLPGSQANFAAGRGTLFGAWWSPTMTGHAAAATAIMVWAWRHHPAPELYWEAGSERLARERFEGLTPYDDWTRKNLIFHPEHGLVKKYPWIDDAFCKRVLKNTWPDVSIGRRLYYAFLHIWHLKFNLRFASGAEVEDVVWFIDALLMSQNVLFVKVCELEAKKAELDQYVNDLLGVPGGRPKEIAYEPKKMTYIDRIADALDKTGLSFKFMKGGPYERDFQQRISKIWVRSMVTQRYSPAVNYIKEKCGMGVA